MYKPKYGSSGSTIGWEYSNIKTFKLRATKMWLGRKTGNNDYGDAVDSASSNDTDSNDNSGNYSGEYSDGDYSDDDNDSHDYSPFDYYSNVDDNYSYSNYPTHEGELYGDTYDDYDILG